MTFLELIVRRREGRWWFVVRQDDEELCIACDSLEEASTRKAIFETWLSERGARCLLDIRRDMQGKK